MSVYQNMAFGLKVAGAAKADIDARIRKAADTLKIGHLLQRLPRELSGGQRQRVAIGRAIVREPKLFLFDEPLSNLDAALRVQTRLEIAKLHQQLGATIVYVTHDQVEAMTLGDKIVVMHEGRVQQAGSPLQLYQQPCNQFVAGFIGSPKMNLLPARVVSGDSEGVLLQLQAGPQVRAAVDGSGVAPGSSVMLGLRAEQALEDEAADAEAFGGRVNMVEHLGEANMLYLTLDHGVDVVVRGHGNRAVAVGAPLRFWVTRDSFHVFDAQGQALRRLRPGNLVASSRAAVAAAAEAA